MEFYSGEEYRRLPDEFNRNYREKTVGTEKRNMLWLLTGFVAITFLLFPLTLKAESSVTSQNPDNPPVIIDPEPQPGPEVQEYDIIGKWESEGQYYEFFENGRGYWSNGVYFVLLDWAKEGNDYHVQGEGLFNYSEKSLSVGIIDFFTQYLNDTPVMNLYGDKGGLARFTASTHEFFLDDIMPLFDSEFIDRLPGVWLHEGHAKMNADGFYVCISYIDFQEGNQAEVEIASTVSARHREYTLAYTLDDAYPNTHIIIGGTERLYFEEVPSPNNTFTYEAYTLNVWRFITEKGEGLIVDGMNTNFLSKWDY
ncbi:MAG: hypothetical protein IJG49_01905 [Erysipelotrichaceae bacterium]|nr:hypothetical protein [Erysipelotrichaceae bacterium]